MKGKEALDNLKETIKDLVCNFEKDYTPLDFEKWYFKTKFETIAKDLEVLELIKALFKENVELGSKVCIGKNYYDINFLLFTSKDAYNKIKEWLEK